MKLRQAWSFVQSGKALLAAGVLAQVYTRAQIPGALFFMLFTAMRQYLQGRGIVTPTLYVALAADLSDKGKRQSAGMMVNYLYDLERIEINHEAYFDQGVIAASKSITRLL